MSDNPIHFEYDAQADMLYVNFGVDEVSVTTEVNEDLLLDVGYYSGLVTGFRIVSPRRKNIAVQVIVEKMIPRVRRMAERRARESLKPIEALKPRRSTKELKDLLSV